MPFEQDFPWLGGLVAGELERPDVLAANDYAVAFSDACPVNPGPYQEIPRRSRTC